MLILQVNQSTDAGKGRSARGAHSQQPPSLSTFDKQFLLKCLFFKSTGTQTQAKGATLVVHTATSPLVLAPLINGLYLPLFLLINWSTDTGKGCSSCGVPQPSRLSTFDKKFMLKCLFFRSTVAQMQARCNLRGAHPPAPLS
jgi:hypothetical protein